jgi:2-polyprenyl-6-hydroxyphenyl methylase/3-demethylubiquinone-9 3-methyltransferase
MDDNAIGHAETMSTLDLANPRGHDVNLRSAPLGRQYEAIVARIAADGPGRVLDWGSGFGQISHMLKRAGVDVTAFDYWPDQEVDGYRTLERYPDVRAYLSSDPRRLPFEDGCFDSVLSCGVLEHVEDPDASLDEIRRVLVPGGRLYVFKLPNRASYLEWIARRVGLYHHGAYPNDRMYGRRSAVELLSRHGLEVVEFRRMSMLPLSLPGRLAARLAGPLWALNRALSRIPVLNLLSTELELICQRR